MALLVECKHCGKSHVQADVEHFTNDELNQFGFPRPSQHVVPKEFISTRIAGRSRLVVSDGVSLERRLGSRETT